MSRARILSDVGKACRALRDRDARHRSVADSSRRRGTGSGRPQVPRESADLFAQFSEAAAKVGVAVCRIDSLDGLAPAIDDIRRKAASGIETLCVGNPHLLKWLAPLAAKGLDVTDGVGRADNQATLSEAHWAIADSGSVVLVSAPDNPTTLAFLPLLHVVIVAHSRLVETLDDAMRLIATSALGERPARAINIVTGASRTGDLGGTIVAGAHGPKHLGIIVYG